MPSTVDTSSGRAAIRFCQGLLYPRIESDSRVDRDRRILLQSESVKNSDLADSLPNVDTRLIPPRFKWLKRFGVAAALLVVALVLLRSWWGYAAHRRLNAQIEQYRAAGQLVFAEEFDAELDAIADAENAAVLYERAMEVYVGTSQSGILLPTFQDDPSAFQSNRAVAEELMTANTQALRLIREARSRPKVAWSERLATDSKHPSWHSTQRMIARVLWFAITFQMLEGNHAEAVHTLRDYVAFNDAVDAYPTVISSLVAWVWHALSFTLIEEYGAELRVREGDSGEDVQNTPAPREDIEQLIRDLLADDSMHHNLARSEHGSRAWALQEVSTSGVVERYTWQALGSRSIPFWEHAINFVTRPMIVLDTARSINLSTFAAQAVLEDTWPLAKSHFAPTRLGGSFLQRLSHPVTRDMNGQLYGVAQRGAEMFFRCLARRRMAAIALAIRLYAVDHGERPTDMTALSPHYFPELPRDPFAIEEATFGYRPLADRPFLYSVGLDGKDNEGKQVLTPNGRRDGKRSDILFYLEPEAPDTSVPEAGDHDQNIENDQGEQPQE